MLEFSYIIFRYTHKVLHVTVFKTVSYLVGLNLQWCIYFAIVWMEDGC